MTEVAAEPAQPSKKKQKRATDEVVSLTGMTNEELYKRVKQLAVEADEAAEKKMQYGSKWLQQTWSPEVQAYNETKAEMLRRNLKVPSRYTATFGDWKVK